MSSKVRRVNYFPDEYIAGVVGVLNGLEQGVYWLLCSLIMSKGEPIVRDDRRFATMLMMRPSDVKKVVDRLLELGKISIVDGVKLGQKRAQSEVEVAAKRIQTASENGTKGGRPERKYEENQQEPKPDGLFSEKLTSTINHQPSTKKESDTDFEEFWSAFPKREGSNPKVPAEVSYRREVAKGADPPAILAAARAYAAAQKRENGGAKSRYTMQAATWLNKKCWLDEAPTKPNGQATLNLEDLTEEKWISWLEYCRPRGEWAKWLGPPPFAPGCKVPPHLLKERDRKMTLQLV
jgi:uncharacterized protein YdaU (DUF1376 family)